MSVSPDGEFAGRRILLTGASGSIGRATALRLTEAGAHVVLSGRDAAKLEQLAATLPAGSTTVAPFDLMDIDGIAGWMQSLADKIGPFSGAVHTSGIQVMKPLRSINAEFVGMNLRVNVAGGIMLGKGLRQRGCHTEGASLVLLSSTAVYIGGAGNVAYSASKGAIISAAKAMAHELVRDKIRVNCVVPGLVESGMSERARAITPTDSWGTVLSGYPMGIGKPDDIAYAIIYLLSDRSKWVTGTELQIDGGLGIV
jgi:NAD(P)-dependent dehydrogenase (short-subunit alcohol dehydrogenase family)